VANLDVPDAKSVLDGLRCLAEAVGAAIVVGDPPDTPRCGSSGGASAGAVHVCSPDPLKSVSEVSVVSESGVSDSSDTSDTVL
jgi:hypothetical protein